MSYTGHPTHTKTKLESAKMNMKIIFRVVRWRETIYSSMLTERNNIHPLCALPMHTKLSTYKILKPTSDKWRSVSFWSFLLSALERLGILTDVLLRHGFMQTHSGQEYAKAATSNEMPLQ